jgi:hypothetical protein
MWDKKAPRPRRQPTRFAATFKRLRGILEPYAKRLGAHDDKPNQYTVSLSDVQDRVGRPLFCGCVRKGKADVSYHLMAVYAPPDLLKDLSPELRKRMQGKSCFTFTTIDPAQVKELEALTKKSAAAFNKKSFEEILPW